MSEKFESAKSKLAHAKEHKTTAVLDADEATALYNIVGSMHILNMSEISKNHKAIALKPDFLMCTACSGSGYYDCSDAKGNSIRCSCCKGTGTVPLEE